MYNIKDVTELKDFVGYAILCAPDRFPMEEFLKPDQQMNFERAFSLMHSGVEVSFPGDKYSKKRSDLHSCLDESKALYESGDIRAGAHRLYDVKLICSK